MNRVALTGARIFDGETLHDAMAAVIADGMIEALMPADRLGHGACSAIS